MTECWVQAATLGGDDKTVLAPLLRLFSCFQNLLSSCLPCKMKNEILKIVSPVTILWLRDADVSWFWRARGKRLGLASTDLSPNLTLKLFKIWRFHGGWSWQNFLGYQPCQLVKSSRTIFVSIVTVWCDIRLRTSHLCMYQPMAHD